ncbi:hypothetical protein EVAR_93170_1 [Eumeta japonica]|uniref:Uncharacterized protein n=1 Tax=Eumeta variegata TaxID=151549 RepID=A0A4C1TI08_EUMVA|nr:hypothetical protein EVAR_93170_1 [Eumeta japonica]
MILKVGVIACTDGMRTGARYRRIKREWGGSRGSESETPELLPASHAEDREWGRTKKNKNILTHIHRRIVADTLTSTHTSARSHTFTQHHVRPRLLYG